jgi:hypothetical protein
MPALTIFPQPYDNAYAALTVAHASGGAALTLDTVSRIPSTISTSAPIYVTVMNTSTSGTTQFRATSLVGSSLSGLTVIGRNNDALYASGSTVEMRIVAQHFTDMYRAINEVQVSGMRIGDVVVSGANGAVPFFGANGSFSQDSGNFFWDNTNKRLGIGTNAPTRELHILKEHGTLGAIIALDNTKVVSAGSDSWLIINEGLGLTFPNELTFYSAVQGGGECFRIDSQGRCNVGRHGNPHIAQLSVYNRTAISTGVNIRIQNAQEVPAFAITNNSNDILCGADQSGRFIQRCVPSLPPGTHINGTTVFVSGAIPYLAIYNGAWVSGLFS